MEYLQFAAKGYTSSWHCDKADRSPWLCLMRVVLTSQYCKETYLDAWVQGGWTPGRISNSLRPGRFRLIYPRINNVVPRYPEHYRFELLEVFALWGGGVFRTTAVP